MPRSTFSRINFYPNMIKVFLFISALCCTLFVSTLAQTSLHPSLKPKLQSATAHTKDVAPVIGHAVSNTKPDVSIRTGKPLVEDPALTAAQQQAVAADRQVVAARVTVGAQVTIAGVTILISCLLLKLTKQQVTEMGDQRVEMHAQRTEMGLQREEMRLQRMEMGKDRAETEKARKLSLMPILECNIIDNYLNTSEDLEQNGSVQYLRHSTIQLHNTGNAPALQTRVTIEQTGGSSLPGNAPLVFEWHTIGPTGLPERAIAILPPHSEFAKRQDQTNDFDFLVTVQYVNAYAQPFTTKTKFHVKAYVEFLRPDRGKVEIVVSQWQKGHEEFKIIGWD